MRIGGMFRHMHSRVFFCNLLAESLPNNTFKVDSYLLKKTHLLSVTARSVACIIVSYLNAVVMRLDPTRNIDAQLRFVFVCVVLDK